MHIGIDARLYGRRGLGRYVEKLLAHLIDLDTTHRYTVFLNEDGYRDFNPTGTRFTKVLSPYQCYSLKEQTLFLWQLRKYPVDLIHFTHFNVPLLYRRPFIVTIHDLILLEYPSQQATRLNPLMYAIKFLAYKWIIRHAIKKSLAVIAISEYTKGAITRYFKVASEKIHVIYEGVSTFVITKKADAPLSGNISYLLYAGSAYPHKNLERLLQAYTTLVFEHGVQEHLVFVGGDDFFYDRLKKYTDDLCSNKPGLRERIHFLGFVPEGTLASLYKNARVYVFPSLCEGFGLPPLEAMAYDVPVAAAQTSCLPEILENAASFFDPTNVESIVVSLWRVLSDATYRQTLIQRGRDVRKKYSWEQQARETVAIYSKIEKIYEQKQ